MRRYAHDVARWKQVLPAAGRGESGVDLYGMRAGLPSQHEALLRRLQFPLAWPASGLPFDLWRVQAREAFLQTLSSPPPKAPYEVQVLATEDRGSYQARKLSLNISADNRIGAYLLVPKGPGPFPAVVALHDHGAHFSIGKEKVVKPFGVSDARMADATDWVNKYYGGRWIGDRLAERGYVVLAIDVLFWGDRGRQEGIQYEAQQQLAANMLQLGVTWAGTNLWDDIRSAEFVQGLPEVDPNRIGCVGLSMGSNRCVAPGRSDRYHPGGPGHLLDGRHSHADVRRQQPDDRAIGLQHDSPGDSQPAGLSRRGLHCVSQADAVLQRH